MADYSGSLAKTGLKMEVEEVDDDGCSQLGMSVQANADFYEIKNNLHNFPASPANRTSDNTLDIKKEIKQENTTDDHDYNTQINSEIIKSVKSEDNCPEVDVAQSRKLGPPQGCSSQGHTSAYSVKLETEDSSDNSDTNDTDNSCDEPSHWCTDCGEVFLDDKSLISHKEIHRKPSAGFSKCFETIKSLQSYVRKNNGVGFHKCEYCNACFARPEGLELHMRTHTERKSYICKHCDKYFASATALAYHTSTHTGEKPYRCKYCDKCFVHSGNLTPHLRTHTGEKPYNCKYCDKCFAHTSGLTIHTRKHTGERPYKCKHCDKCFAHSSGLAYHTRIHTGEKPYKCKYCDKCFTQSGNMTLHLRSHTYNI